MLRHGKKVHSKWRKYDLLSKIKLAKLQKNLRFTTFLENAFTAVEENHANVKVADATKSCFHDKINYCKSETISFSMDSIMESFHFFFSGALSKNPLSSCHLCPTGFCRKGLPRDFGSGHHHKVIKCFLPSKSKSTSLKCFAKGLFRGREPDGQVRSQER